MFRLLYVQVCPVLVLGTYGDRMCAKVKVKSIGHFA